MTKTAPPPKPTNNPIDEMTVDELAGAVRYHNVQYFVHNAPEIDDYSFDRITRRLRDLAPNHPALEELLTDKSNETKVQHDAPMLSLDKIYDEKELWERWITSTVKKARVRRFQGDVIESPKVDGVAASFKYDASGRLIQAVTRGDGKQGETFLPNARFIEDVPQRIAEGPIEVRGELYMKLSVFRQFAAEFSNPRNTTAGAIKQKDPRATGRYGLSFFTYDVLGKNFDTEMDKAAWAVRQGFPMVESRKIPVEDIQAGYEHWIQHRSEVDFELDGVVYKINRIEEQRRLGVTAHHPRYAIAYKFRGDSGESILNAVQWSVSRTGAITPVALIEPIELSGAMVSRCSLHNLSILKKLNISLGATVVAMRRGGVIPHIEKVKASGHTPVAHPRLCPSCQEPTRVESNERKIRNKETGQMESQAFEFLFCSRPEQCPDAIRGTLEHFLKAAEIDGFGPKLVAQLLEAGLVREPADLFRLRIENLESLERMGETLARKLISNLQGRRRLPLSTFLRALGIDDLGSVVSNQLAKHARTLDACRRLEVVDLAGDKEAGLEGLGGFQDTLARSIVEGLQIRSAVIDALLEVVRVDDFQDTQQGEGELTGHALAGKSFVFTGTMASLDRKKAQIQVLARGGTTPSSVTKDLDFLVVGDKGSPLLGDGRVSSKQKKADAYIADGAPISVISETRFLEMLEEKTEPPNPNTDEDGPAQGSLPI